MGIHYEINTYFMDNQGNQVSVIHNAPEISITLRLLQGFLEDESVDYISIEKVKEEG